MRIVVMLFCLALAGCVARTAFDVASFPVRAGAKAVDWTTTSRDEADRNEGRRLRRAREREEREARKAERRRRRDAGRACQSDASRGST